MKTLKKQAAAGIMAGLVLTVSVWSYTITGAQAPDSLYGVPLGGIGTGKLMITPKGTFKQITIDDDPIWSDYGGRDSPAGTYFAVYTKGAAAWSSKLDAASGVAIDYTGYFPKATLTYTHASLPIALTMTAFSPFIPGNKDAYSLPAAYFKFALKNTQSTSVDAAIVFSWQGLKAVSSFAQIMNGTALKGLKSNFLGGGYCIEVKSDGAITTSCGSALTEFTDDGVMNNSPSGSIGAVAAKATLAAGQTQTITFVFAWDIPAYALKGNTADNVGHWYSNKLSGADNVADFACANAETYLSQVDGWQGKILSSTLPDFLKDMLCNNLYIMNTLTCLGKDGRYSMSEGLQYTWMGTLDQRFVGTIPVLVFAPDCEKSEMTLFANQQTAAGQIGHDIGSQRLNGPCGYGCNMVELNPKFTLMTLRNYYWTGDSAMLAAMWPKVKKALQLTKTECDAATCLLMQQDNISQTYDCTQFASSYSNGIWLASLLAGAEIARIMGDQATAATYQTWYTTGRQSYEAGLWNETYGFYQMQNADQTCMYDQLCGHMYADYLGLGKICQASRVQRAIAYIPKRLGGTYGLKNGLRPDGSAPSGISCGGEPTATWPGYPPAGYCAMSMYNNVADSGLSWMNAIYRGIYTDRKHVWRQECKQDVNTGLFFDGNIHYMNLGAVWHVLYGLTGLNIDIRGQRLWVRPSLPSKTTYMSNNSLRAPIAFPTTWGMLDYKQGATPNDQTISMTLDNPTVIRTVIVRTTSATPSASVTLGATPVACTVTKTGDDAAELAFATPVTVNQTPLQIVMPTGNVSAAARKTMRRSAALDLISGTSEAPALGYRLSRNADVNLSVYDMQGKRLATLVRAFQKAGDYRVGARCPQRGMLMCVLAIDGHVIDNKMFVSK